MVIWSLVLSDETRCNDFRIRTIPRSAVEIAISNTILPITLIFIRNLHLRQDSGETIEKPLP